MRYLIIITISFTVLFTSCDNNTGGHTYQPQKIDKNSVQDTLLKANKFLIQKDKERIESYIERKNWSMKTTATGLWYEIYTQTQGKKLAKGELIKINYKIELLDGTLCYSSDSIGPKTIKLGKSGEISGLEEALSLMKIGEKGRFIMPPYMAMGILGDRDKIPARSILVYDIEVIKKIDF